MDLFIHVPQLVLKFTVLPKSTIFPALDLLLNVMLLSLPVEPLLQLYYKYLCKLISPHLNIYYMDCTFTFVEDIEIVILSSTFLVSFHLTRLFSNNTLLRL